jgi:hypothetical protein
VQDKKKRIPSKSFHIALSLQSFSVSRLSAVVRALEVETRTKQKKRKEKKQTATARGSLAPPLRGTLAREAPHVRRVSGGLAVMSFLLRRENLSQGGRRKSSFLALAGLKPTERGGRKKKKIDVTVFFQKRKRRKYSTRTLTTMEEEDVDYGTSCPSIVRLSSLDAFFALSSHLSPTRFDRKITPKKTIQAQTMTSTSAMKTATPAIVKVVSTTMGTLSCLSAPSLCLSLS